MSEPDFYSLEQMSSESLRQRQELEERLDGLYEKLRPQSGVERLRIQRSIEQIEERLAWQGANPKLIDFLDLKKHIRKGHPDIDALEAKYRERISSRATAIRAYCVMCQGADTAAVRDCASLTCPLHPFRMGKDPFRGYELPKVEIVIEDDEDDIEDFTDEDDNDAD